MLWPPLSWAASDGGLGVFPANPDPEVPFSSSWFIYNLVAGEVKGDAILISNNSNQQISAKIYAVDATTTKDGAFALREEGEPRLDIGGWVDLDISQVTIEPGEERVIPFTLKIPSDAAVGDHLGGIILENLKAKKAEGQGINIVTRVGVRIYETVPGELIRRLRVNDFSYRLKNNQVVFSLILENLGNIHLSPQAEIEILDGFFGRKLTSFAVDLRSVFPGKSTEVPFTWEKAPPMGKLIARAKISFGDKPGDTIQQELAFSYLTTKGKAILVLVGLILVAFLTIINLRR